MIVNIEVSIMDKVKPLLIKENIYIRDILYAFEGTFYSAFLDNKYEGIVQQYNLNRNRFTFIGQQLIDLVHRSPIETLYFFFTKNELIIFHRIRKPILGVIDTITKLDLKSILEFQLKEKLPIFGECYSLKLDRSINLALFVKDTYNFSNFNISNFIFTEKKSLENQRKQESIQFHNNMSNNKSFQKLIQEINDKLIFNIQNNLHNRTILSIEDKINSLIKLNKLLEDKVITKEEFDTLKKELNNN
jgi:hypothetical protein